VKILVIGGTGFISSTLVGILLERGHHITLFSRSGWRHVNGTGTGALHHIQGDRTRPNDLAVRTHGMLFDALIDMVAYKPEESASAVGIFEGRVGRFIHCSTVSVYMVSSAINVPVSEDQASRPLMPRWDRNPFGMDYGIQKRRCEDVLWQAHHDVRFPVTMLRPTFVSGPADPAQRDWFWIERIMDGGPLLVPGTGNDPFQQVFVSDVARAFADLLQHPATIGNAYNVAAEESFTLNGYIGRLGEMLGRDPELVHIPQEEFDRLPFSTSPEGDVFTFNTRTPAVFSLEALRRDIGYRSTPFAKWMGDTIAWWRAPGRRHSFGYAQRPEELRVAKSQRASRSGT
jgi:nucleoside-diphosphate-sugar epimerase